MFVRGAWSTELPGSRTVPTVTELREWKWKSLTARGAWIFGLRRQAFQFFDRRQMFSVEPSFWALSLERLDLWRSLAHGRPKKAERQSPKAHPANAQCQRLTPNN